MQERCRANLLALPGARDSAYGLRLPCPGLVNAKLRLGTNMMAVMRGERD